MELQEALAQIAEIRQQMARAEVFRGYRAAPVAFSGLLAFGAAVYQSVRIADPIADLPEYLVLWVGAAVLMQSPRAWAWHGGRDTPRPPRGLGRAHGSRSSSSRPAWSRAGS